MRGEVRAEWDEVKQHDVLFLMTIRPPLAGELEARASAGQGEPNPAEKYGLVYVRGCEVVEVCSLVLFLSFPSPKTCACGRVYSLGPFLTFHL